MILTVDYNNHKCDREEIVNHTVNVYVGLQRYPYIGQLRELVRRRLTRGQPGAPRCLGRV